MKKRTLTEKSDLIQDYKHYLHAQNKTHSLFVFLEYIELIKFYSVNKEDIATICKCKDCDKSKQDERFDGDWYFCKNNQMTHYKEHFCGYGERKKTQE